MDILKMFRKKPDHEEERDATNRIPQRIVKSYTESSSFIIDPTILVSAKKIIENSIYVDRCIKENGKRISSLDVNQELKMNSLYVDQEMLYAIYASMELEGYAVLWYDGYELKLLEAAKVSREAKSGSFAYTYSGKTVYIPRKEIAILHNFTPFLNVYGRSALTSAVRAIVNSYKDQELAVRNFYKNGMFANAFITTEKELSRRNYDELVAQIVEQFSGPENAGSIPIMHSGAEVKTLSLSPDQFKQLASDNVILENIALAFEVPPLLLGRMESGWDNKEPIMEHYVNNTIIPKAKNLASQIDKFILPLMRRSGEFYFIYDNIPELQRAKERQALALTPMVTAGILTVNNVRERLGYDPVPWGNKPMNPMGSFLNDEEEKQEEKKNTKEEEEPKKNHEEEEEEKEEEKKTEKKAKDFHGEKFKTIHFTEPSIWHKGVREDNHKRIEQFESILRPKYRTIFKQMKKDIMEQVKELKVPEDVKHVEVPGKYLKKFKSLGRTYFPNLYYMAGQSVMLAYPKKKFMKAGVPGLFDVQTSFNLDDPFLQKVIDEQIGLMAEDIYKDSDSLLKGLLNGAIKQGKKEGEGITDIMRRITNYVGDDMEGWTDYRSERIARTEGMKINTRGGTEGARQNKMNAKAWLHSGAVNFRSSHKAMNPQHFIPLEAYFNVGGVKMFGPGDGPAGEVVNCGCSLLYDWRE